jgi:chloramphenicol-sensitive protein RarD
MNRGILYAACAYLFWGFLPVYWKALQAVSATQILAHRVIWSFILLMGLLLIKRDLPNLRLALQDRRNWAASILAAGLLTVNWLTYIWGVNAGFIVETSLGYFINPLVNVLLGVLFLREKLRSWQWLPVGLASVGVLYLTFSYGRLPWISLVLAFSFGLYGLIKKTASLGALHGLSVETGIMFLPATFYLLFAASQGEAVFGNMDVATNLLLVFTGVVTALPLLLFGAAARRIHLSTLGILQYIAPTCQFLIGVYIYGEPFTQERLIGFSIIWIALLIYSIEGILERRKAELTTAA